MNAVTIAALGLSVAALITMYGFWDSYAEPEPNALNMILTLISDTQSDIQHMTARIAELETANTELIQRVDDLEHQLSDANITDIGCGSGYWPNMETSVCEKIQTNPAD